jgi:hypothetical protein
MENNKSIFHLLISLLIGGIILVSFLISGELSQASPGVVSGNCPACIFQACGEGFFTLSNSGTITAWRGQSGSNTITVGYLDGAGSIVSLAVTSVLPAGATVSFAPNSTCTGTGGDHPTCNRTLTIQTADPATLAGAYNITVTGTGSDGSTVTTSFSLNVNDFYLWNDREITITPGASDSNAIGVEYTDGSGTTVTLSFSGLPAGTTGSLSSNTCTNDCTRTFTIQSIQGVTTGVYPITVTGVAAGLTRSTVFNLVINALPLPTPPPPSLPPPPPGGPGCTATMDIVFAIDTTISMNWTIAQAQAQASEIMYAMDSVFPGSDIRYGVVDFRDYADGGNWPVFYRQSLTYTRADVQNAIDAMSAGGGLDLPEAYARVMYESYNSFGYRGGANVGRFLIMLGDEQSHDMANCCTGFGADGAYSSPFNDPQAGISTLAIANNMRSNGIILINLHSGSYSGQWAPIAQATGGNNYPISANPNDLVNVITNAILTAFFDTDQDGYIKADCPCDPANPPPGKVGCDDQNDSEKCVNPAGQEGMVCETGGNCPAVGSTTVINGQTVWVCTMQQYTDTNVCVINCGDNFDNNQDGQADLGDLNCPVPSGLVPCGRQRDAPDTLEIETDSCTLCHFFILGKRIFDFLFLYFSIPLAVLMVIIGGVFILTAGGSPERTSQGRKILTAAIVGIVIFFASWIIVNTVLSFLTMGGPPSGIVSIFGTPWNQINCPAGGAPLCP